MRDARTTHMTAHLESPMHQELYDEMAALLNSDGMNYTVFLRCHTGRVTPGLTLDQSIHAVLGPGCVIDDVRDVDAGEVEAVVRNSLAYVGEVHSGPGTATLASTRFGELLDAILADCRRAHADSEVAASFFIVDGHPAYPVFWDFSLFFGGAEEYVVLVGSSSD